MTTFRLQWASACVAGAMAMGCAVAPMQTSSVGATGEGGQNAGNALFADEEIATFEIKLGAEGKAALTADPKKSVAADVDVTLGGVTTTFPGVGVKLKGGTGSFRTLDQKASFRLDFDHSKRGQKLDGMERLVLNNMVSDPTMMHERIGYAIMRAAGLPAPRTGYARVRVDGEDYGLHVTIESADDHAFLKSRFGTNEGTLYEGEDGADFRHEDLGAFDQDNGPEVDMADLAELVATLDVMMADPATLVEDLGKVVDVDEYALFVAASTYLGHWDGYPARLNNFYVHRSPSDGRFVFIPWGIDQTFHENLKPFGDAPGRLQLMCLASTPCRQKLASAYTKLFAGLAKYDAASQIKAAKHLIWADLQKDPRKEADATLATVEIEAMIDFVNNRQARIEKDLPCADLFAEVDIDNDGFSRCTDDCNDEKPAIHPGGMEYCNFIDDDCSGVLDDAAVCATCKLVPAKKGGSLAFCKDPRTWFDAEADCVARGGHLASIHDGEDQYELYTQAFPLSPDRWKDYWWVGGNDQGEEGMFIWSDGTPFDYSFWLSDQPNDDGGDEDCLDLSWWVQGTWNDVACEAKLQYICKLP